MIVRIYRLKWSIVRENSQLLQQRLSIIQGSESIDRRTGWHLQTNQRGEQWYFRSEK